MKKEKHEKTKSTGFGLRLSFAIILLFFSIVYYAPVVVAGIRVMAIFSALMLIVGILQFVAAVKGKTKKWANTMSIVIGWMFVWIYGLGVLAIVGGSRGKKALSTVEQNAETIKPENPGTTAVATNAETLTENAEIEKEPLEYIQPKLSPKAKKGMFITVIVSYALLLIAGVLLVSIPAMGKIFSGMGMCEELSAHAYAVTVGTMWLALLPTIGYYIAFVAPFELGKKKKTVAFSLSAVLSVALCAVFFIVINLVKIDGFPIKDYFEEEDSWFVPVSMVFAVIGLTVCYILTLFKINPAKIKTKKPEKCSDGFFAVIKHIFSYLGYSIMRLTKAILSFKEKQPEVFLFVATFLLTWFVYFVSFIVSIIVIAVLIGVVSMWFFGTINYAYSPEVGRVSNKKITADGKTLTKMDYVAYDGSEVYHDEYGNVYYSSDGGKSVIRSVDKSIAKHDTELEQIRTEEAEKQRREEEVAEELRRLNELNSKW